MLTGIIDSPETYIRIKNLFSQVLIWVLLQKRIFSIKKENNSVLKKSNFAEKNPKKNAISDIESNLGECLHSFPYDALQPISKWSNASYQYSKVKTNLNPNHVGYSLEWFQKVLKQHTNDQCQLNLNELQSLYVMYKNIANTCYYIVFPPTYTKVPTSQSIVQIFNGELAKADIEKMFFESNPDLYSACVKSFQYCTKIAFDQVIYGNDDDKLSTAEMGIILLDYDQNWHFGNRILPEWKQSVLLEKQNLFSISRDVMKVFLKL